MKVYALDVRNVELNKSFYKNLIAMGFNMNGLYGYKAPLTDGFSQKYTGYTLITIKDIYHSLVRLM